ncbi:Glyceraldehyde-3-phosphate dehydrogenase [Candidatus Xenohaliotis californiensis]|uniref:Glyceraldehyde-3-phosphate dehydrogenase n=1 Tax=Candidatus Xenohaliotis californiensis TaxID=84677 RepID=A0ABP0EVB1_9RICK|nr:Glyceraldehyde-3-phosphate dehydrogenase [Candidatus Xenohaliotis californiensis]
MRIKIAINGFGRIGRCLLRSACNLKNNKLQVVAINSSTDLDSCAYYAKYDSNYGLLGIPVLINKEQNTLTYGNNTTVVTNYTDPASVPWGDYGVDIVMECTGKFNSYDKASRHLLSGVQKVIISAPAENVEPVIVYGVNHMDIKSKHQVISAASCTTNCLAPVVKTINDVFGIISGHMTTIHSYTNDQSVLDANHKDLRRSRASALSMIPTSTGAAKNIGLVLPELSGKIDGAAIRVPTPTVSMIDFVFVVEKQCSVNRLNEVFVQAAERLNGVLSTTSDPLVSTDFIGSTFSAIVDLTSTKSIGSNMYRVVAWYDNEYAFATRMLDIAEFWMSS